MARESKAKESTPGWQHLRTLAVDIGPRGSATAAERRAALYVRDVFARLGFEVAVEGFRSVSSFSWTYGLLYLAFVVSAVIFPKATTSAAILSLAALLLYLWENTTREGLSLIIPKRPSQNVLARLRPGSVEGQSAVDVGGIVPRTRVVFVAHCDSSRSALSFHPKMVAGFKRSFWLMTISMFVITTLYCLAAAVGPTSRLFLWGWWLSLPFAAYLAIVVLLLVHREVFGRYTHGANDNASGVAAMLSVAERVSKEGAPRGVDVWFLATGAEEAGTVGMLRFLDRHGQELDKENTFFINFDNLGAGQVTFVTKEGMLAGVTSDPDLVAAAVRATKMEPELPASGRPYVLMPTDATPALVRGYRAMSIMALDANGLLPNWHWVTDVIANVRPENIGVASELAWRMLKILGKPDFQGGKGSGGGDAWNER